MLGVLPGGGATLELVRRLRAGEEGSRAIRRGSAAARSRAWPAPESANNAGAQTSFIPMLTLGIPGNAVMALMIGALTIHGIQPGPQIMTERPTAVLGHGRLDVDRQPDAGHHQPAADRHLGAASQGAVPLSVSRDPAVLRRSASTRSATARSRCCSRRSSACSASSSMRLDCEPAPMILGFVLGPLMEDNLRRAMRISSGDPMIFLNRPISLGLLDRRRRAVAAGGTAGDPRQARRGFRRELT